jgi:hypothetical protein
VVSALLLEFLHVVVDDVAVLLVEPDPRIEVGQYLHRLVKLSVVRAAEGVLAALDEEALEPGDARVDEWF